MLPVPLKFLCSEYPQNFKTKITSSLAFEVFFHPHMVSKMRADTSLEETEVTFLMNILK